MDFFLELEQHLSLVQPLGLLSVHSLKLLNLTTVLLAVDLTFEPTERLGPEALEVAITKAFSPKKLAELILRQRASLDEQPELV